ncbi:hypothetical protein [Staphylococcus pseudintermedius]|uniref:hypothetical protein n=1 Tax=Staphylococcus pseudintermedius TaxID=283734 RepID=UPI0021B42939|nr:hypothetical protein [Staphylococcus pseudintermedius]
MNMMKECQHLFPIHHHNFNTDFPLFNTQNGYIDLTTGPLHDHEKNKFFTKMSNPEYTDNADCPIWLDFLNDIFFGRKELFDYIQRAEGY